jgi:CheY-like chemotaxis protein
MGARAARILLADDNELDVELILRALNRAQCPHEVAVANNGADALDYLHHRGRFESQANSPPIVILLDVKMPKVDGLEVLRELKRDARLRLIPVVMLTSSRVAADVRKAYELGANAYVVKPVEFQALVAAVQQIEQFWTAVNEPPPEDHAPVTGGLAPEVVAA